MKMKFKKSEILVVFALKPESLGRPEKLGFKTLYTGVGKVNATISLMEYLLNTNKGKEIKWVLNLGSAGSQSLKRGSLVFGEEIKQYDMDVTPLGFELGITPFDKTPESYKSLDIEGAFLEAFKGLVLTGDRFVTQALPWKGDAIDMEAFALVKVCHTLNIEFTTLKYITDGANSSSGKDWPKEVKKSALKFEEILASLNFKFKETK